MSGLFCCVARITEVEWETDENRENKDFWIERQVNKSTKGSLNVSTIKMLKQSGQNYKTFTQDFHLMSFSHVISMF